MSTGIGATLRAARRAQGRSLSDAAAATRVRETYLAALEQDDVAALGDEVYARGFLRSYARFLGLDERPLLEAFTELTDASPRQRGRTRRGHTVSAPPGGLERERPAGAAVLLVLVLVVVVAVAILGLWTDADAAAALGGAIVPHASRSTPGGGIVAHLERST